MLVRISEWEIKINERMFFTMDSELAELLEKHSNVDKVLWLTMLFSNQVYLGEMFYILKDEV